LASGAVKEIKANQYSEEHCVKANHKNKVAFYLNIFFLFVADQNWV
jgi:hypothetical protein